MTLHEGHKPNLHGLIVGILLLLAACTLAVPALSSTISNIPLDHRINSYVDELGRRGLLKGFFFSEKPYSREEVCAVIGTLDKALEAGEVELSPYEAWLVER
jgi:hypothetical protein